MKALSGAEFNRILARAFLIPISLLVVLAAVLALQITGLLSASYSVDHADRVISEIRQSQKLLVDMETGLRGFLLTGNREFLQPYNEALREIPPNFENLRSLFAPHSGQRASFESLQLAYLEWSAYANSLLELEKAGGDIRSSTLNLRGKQLMDGMRARVLSMLTEQDTVASTRRKNAETAATITIGSALGLTLLVGFLISIFSRMQLTQLVRVHQEALDSVANSAENARKLARQNELILNSAGEGIFGVDLQGLVTFINKTGAKLLQWPPEDFIGQRQHSIIHHSHPDGTPYPQEECPIYAAFMDGRIHRCDTEVFFRKDGVAIPVEYMSTPIWEEGKLAGAVVSFKEISEQQTARKTIASLLAETRQALAGRDEFLSIAAHELKTPLTSMRLQWEMFGKFLEAGTWNTPPGRWKRMLQIGEAQVARLSRLIDQLLDVAILQRGAMKPEKVEVELRSLVQEVIEQYSPAEGCSNSLFVVEPGGNLLGKWDPYRLQQVVLNLLSNALKYGGGKPVRISLNRGANEATLVVRDQGIGMAPEDLGRVFQRFERAASSRNYGGLGLGLYISRRIVEAHGGRIEVHSELGRGATFTVHLPLEPSPSTVVSPMKGGDELPGWQ